MPTGPTGTKKKTNRSGAAANRERRKPARTLEEFFGPNGPLASALPGYEQRHEQLEVSKMIEMALAEGKPCLAEAGTGVGKTMAYLVPVVQAALKGKRTVISTHTINLQNQLVDRDIPLVLSLIPGAQENVQHALMKGRGNYLCKAALDYARTDMFLADDPLFKKVQRWANLPGCSGDLGDLPFNFSAWYELTSTPDTCAGQECALFDTCHLYDMRRRGAESNIIVVNHALFFSDLKVRMEGAEVGILPDYNHVVFDEAHHLEDVATKTFGIEFNSGRLTNLVDRIKRVKGIDIDAERLKSLEQLNQSLFAPFQQAARAEFTFQEVLNEEKRPQTEDATLQTCVAITELQKQLRSEAKENEKLKERLDGLASMCDRAREELTRLFFESDENAIRWGEVAVSRRAASPETRVSLHLTPIEVSKVLGDALWDRMALRGGGVVMVSATLANSGGFEYQRKRLGVPEGALECLVGSPFDFKTKALLYVPAHLPAPAPGSEYAGLLSDEIEKLLELTEGRAFLLFTSRFMMNAVYERLDGKLPFPMYKQGDMPPAKLVEEFRNSGNGCLFGLQTFWEGVDVQGDALTCVIIDRLPFAVPDSPITRARTQAITDAGGDWFNEFAVPQAQIRLKQGFGRLIRTQSDTGIVCILDSRLLTRGYGADFVRYLPPASRASKWNRVERFYNGLASVATQPEQHVAHQVQADLLSATEST